jgi:ribosomal protein L37E
MTQSGLTERAGHVQCCALLGLAAQLQTSESSMTNSDSRFRCPACGFAVYNRRVAKCESCSAALPPELRFTPEELKAVEAEHESNEKVRQQLAREAAEREASDAERRRFNGTFGGSY